MPRAAASVACDDVVPGRSAVGSPRTAHVAEISSATSDLRFCAYACLASRARPIWSASLNLRPASQNDPGS